MESLEGKLLLDEGTGLIYYYHEGAYYNAEDLRRMTHPPSRHTVVLDLEEGVTAPEEFTSSPVFVRTEDGFTVLVTEGEQNVDLNYVQSFDPDTEEAITDDPFESRSPILDVRPFQIPGYDDSPSTTPEQLPAMSYGTQFNEIWLARLNDVQRRGLGLHRVDPSPVEPMVVRSPMEIIQAYVPQASIEEITESLQWIEDIGDTIVELMDRYGLPWSSQPRVSLYSPTPAQVVTLEGRRPEPTGHTILDQYGLPRSSRPQVAPGSITVRQRLRLDFPLVTHEQIEEAIESGHGTYIGGRDYLRQNLPSSPRVREGVIPYRSPERVFQVRPEPGRRYNLSTEFGPDGLPRLRIVPPVQVPTPNLTEEEVAALYVAYSGGANVEGFIPPLVSGMSRDNFAHTVRGDWLLPIEPPRPNLPQVMPLISVLRERFPQLSEEESLETYNRNRRDLFATITELERRPERQDPLSVPQAAERVPSMIGSGIVGVSPPRFSQGRTIEEINDEYNRALDRNRGSIVVARMELELTPAELNRMYEAYSRGVSVAQLPRGLTREQFEIQFSERARGMIPRLTSAVSQMRTTEYSPSPQPSPRREEVVSIEPSEVEQSYQTLLRQLYGLPVELPPALVVNGLHSDLVPFDQVSTLPIERFDINPVLQPWAGPPGTPNRIITLILRDGRVVLVKARFDQRSSQIFPPA